MIYVAEIKDLGASGSVVFLSELTEKLDSLLGTQMPLLLSSVAVKGLIDSGQAIESSIGPITYVIGDDEDAVLAALGSELEEDGDKYASRYQPNAEFSTMPIGFREVIRISITPEQTPEQRVLGDTGPAPTLVLANTNGDIVGALWAAGDDVKLLVGLSDDDGALVIHRILSDRKEIAHLMGAYTVYPDTLPQVRIEVGTPGSRPIALYALAADEDATEHSLSDVTLVHSDDIPSDVPEIKAPPSQIEHILGVGSGGYYLPSDLALPVDNADRVVISFMPRLLSDLALIDKAGRPPENRDPNNGDPTAFDDLHGKNVFVAISPKHDAEVREQVSKRVIQRGGHLLLTLDTADFVVYLGERLTDILATQIDANQLL